MNYFTTRFKSSPVLLIAGLTLGLVGCFANPTPHPANDATNAGADAFTGGDGTTATPDGTTPDGAQGPDAAPPGPDASFDTAADAAAPDVFGDAATGDVGGDATGDVGGDVGGDGGGDVQEDAGGDAALDTVESDASDDVPGGQDVGLPGTFSCGSSGLACDSDQACQSMGQGACGGSPPDSNGQCPADCYATECGGGVYCLCDSFECVDLPTSCTDCSCVGQEYDFCVCDDSDGNVRLNCPGA